MSKYNELDSVLALKDLNANVKAGTSGVIHQVYESPNEVFYLVEFIIDAEQNIIDVLDVNERDVKLNYRWK